MQPQPAAGAHNRNGTARKRSVTRAGRLQTNYARSVIILVLVMQIRPDIFISSRICRVFIIFRPQVPEGVVLRVPQIPWLIASPYAVPAGVTTATIPFCSCHFVLTSHTTKQLFIPAL